MPFAAPVHLAEGLCPCALLRLKVENSFYLPCRHTNTNSIHDGIEIYFDLKNSNKK
jgi:hypothetical protein